VILLILFVGHALYCHWRLPWYTRLKPCVLLYAGLGHNTSKIEACDLSLACLASQTVILIAAQHQLRPSGGLPAVMIGGRAA
jgi:hypothetical protein